MREWQKRQMVSEGILSYFQGEDCVTKFFPAYYTRVRSYLSCIDDYMHIKSLDDRADKLYI